MVNSQVQKEINNALKIDERVEKTPSAIPVIEVGLKHSNIGVIESNTATNAASATVYTTPADKQFYLKGFTISHVRDAANAGTSYGLTFVVDGATKTINFPIRASLAITTPTMFSISFDSPIKIDKSTQINVINAANTAYVNTTLSIFGFLDEVN